MIVKAGIGNGLFHGQYGIGRTFTHKAQLFTVNMFSYIKLYRAMNLTAKPQLGIFGRGDNAGCAIAQCVGDFFNIISNRRNDADPGDCNTSHDD